MSKHASIASDSLGVEKEHKTFSKEVSGKKVVDSLFKKLFADPELRGFWAPDGVPLSIETINHQQDVMMEIAFGAGLLEEDKHYLREVHAEAISYSGLSLKHFDLFVKHFEATLMELSHIIPGEKVKEAIINIKACKVIFDTGKKK